MRIRNDLTIEDVLSELDYIPEAGVFIRKKSWKNRKGEGAIAGFKSNNGYWHIGVKGRSRLAHRLVWLCHHGIWPKYVIDHIDGNRLNNKIDNLREANMSQNAVNSKLRSTNKSGYTGVSWDKEKNSWVVMVSHEQYKRKLVGRFKNLSDAIKASAKAREDLHGKFLARREA